MCENTWSKSSGSLEKFKACCLSLLAWNPQAFQGASRVTKRLPVQRNGEHGVKQSDYLGLFSVVETEHHSLSYL